MRKRVDLLGRASDAARHSKSGLTNVQIAGKMKISGAYVARLLTLASAPEKLKNYIRGNRISATYAMDLLGRATGREISLLIEHYLAEELANGNRNARVTKSRVGKSRGGRRLAQGENQLLYKPSTVDAFINVLVKVASDATLAKKDPKTGRFVALKSSEDIRGRAQTILQRHGVDVKRWPRKHVDNNSAGTQPFLPSPVRTAIKRTTGRTIR